MYTYVDLIKNVTELNEKILNTEITEYEYMLIEKELDLLFDHVGEVADRVNLLVSETKNACKLHREIQESTHELYSKLKEKRLIDAGVDVCDEYNKFISYKPKYCDFLEVELKRTPK